MCVGMYGCVVCVGGGGQTKLCEKGRLFFNQHYIMDTTFHIIMSFVLIKKIKIKNLICRINDLFSTHVPLQYCSIFTAGTKICM